MQKCLGSMLAAFLFAAPLALAQSNAPSESSPQAVTLATQAMAALVGSTQVSDVTLTGTGTRTAGSDVASGTVALKALGINYSRLDLTLSDGSRSEIRNLSGTTPQGVWIGLDGTAHAMADHNCLTAPAWFFPALTVLSQLSNPNLAISYVGQETRNGVSVQHIQFLTRFPTLDPQVGNFLSPLTASDIYLNAATSLPVALLFNSHPDINAGINMPVEVDFSDYQLVQGVQVPFRIQQLMNGTLFLDLTIQAAVLNSGLTSSAFSPN
jgi:hypothetical protein